jgi:hypothetical protein
MSNIFAADTETKGTSTSVGVIAKNKLNKQKED